jgi:hypothetical protein
LISRLYLPVDFHNIRFVYRSRNNILHGSPIPCPSGMRPLLHYFFLKPQNPVENRGLADRSKQTECPLLALSRHRWLRRTG